MSLSQYDKNILSEEDQRRVELEKQAYLDAYNKGDKNGMASANARAEAIRAGYGYSGGEGGANYVALPGYEGAETLKKADEGLDAAYSGVNDVYRAQAEASKADIDKQREATLKQIYIGNMMDQKNIDQQLRASGVTGGLSETSRVALQQNYRTNRNNVENSALTAKKDIDLQTQQNIAQNEVNRTQTKYNAQTAQAQFQNTAAANNRNIKQQEYSNSLTERQLALSEDQAALSKYTSFIQSGLVDESNVASIARSIGASEDAVLKASKAVQNADYAAMALNLLSAGVYDDSFVNLLGGRFSAETLKAYANKSASAAIKSTPSKSSPSSPEDNQGSVKTEDDGEKTGDDGEKTDEEGILSELEKEMTAANSNLIKNEGFKKMLLNVGMSYSDWQAYAGEYGFGRTLGPTELRSMARKFGVSANDMSIYLNLTRGKYNE